MKLKKHFSRISPIMNDEDAGVQVKKDYMHIETEAQLESYKRISTCCENSCC